MTSWITKLVQPAENHLFVSQLFIKGLCVIYFSAFLSLSVQITGLVGSHGLLPLEPLLKHAFHIHGSKALWLNPSVFWLNSSDLALFAACLAGCLLALLTFLNIAQRLGLIGMFLLYLSLTHAGQTFLNFQWDYLLLESGFLAIFLFGGTPLIAVLMLEFLLLRLRFLSGLSKLLSDDPSWATATALNYYFETQPLPHLGGWLAHQLPEFLLRSLTLTALISELIIPLLIFLPRRFRVFAALVTIALQLGIIATSNHNFLNILTILLCLFLLDDRFFKIKLKPARGFKFNKTPRYLALPAALLILCVSLPLSWQMLSRQQLPDSMSPWIHAVRNFGIGNIYHVFPTMQTERQELIIQGSADGIDWLDYEFKYKPGATNIPPMFILPHQPRLDWMMWFVPPQHPREKHWFRNLIAAISSNNQAVLKLMKHNPFADKPPRYVRVLAYRYRFSSAAEFQLSGNFWKRELLGEFPFVPPRIP